MDVARDLASTKSARQITARAVRGASRLDHLTSLRFFAALAVLLFHLSYLIDPDNTLGQAIHTLFGEGYCGVPFFFILSGFILGHTYQTALLSGAISARKYLLLRMARIFPLHWITAAILVSLSYGPSPLPSHTVLNFLLLQSWIPNVLSLPNGATWTLSVELFFYCTFIFLIRLSTRSIAFLCLMWGIAICIAALCSVVQDWPHGLSEWLFLISPLTRLLEFMMGILIFRLTRAVPETTRIRTEWLSAVLLATVAVVYGLHKFHDAIRYQILYLPFMAFLLFSFARGSGMLSNLLRSRALVLLGEASFALYMIHAPIIGYAYGFYERLGSPFPRELLALILAVVCIGTSVVVYKAVEMPMHQYLKKVISRNFALSA